MGGLIWEALGDDRIAFAVDLEASAVHEPRPGAFDDPAFGERFELAGMDAVDHFDADVVVAAVLDEGALEARVAPQLGETCSGALRAAWSRTVIPPTLSEMLAATTTTAMRSPSVSTIPKVLRPLIRFPASNPLDFLLTVAPARTERASTMPAEGSPSRPSFVRTVAARHTNNAFPRCRRVTR